MHELFKAISDWFLANLNYGTIVLLMGIESSFIPFPSEIVIPPAAYKAAQGELNIILVVLCGIAGSLLGALFNYVVAIKLGRAVMYRLADTKLAHLLLIDRAGVEKAESWFLKYGKSSTFIGRLVPAVRQLISLPAGLARMPIVDFILFTLLGSGIWTSILAALGYVLYSQREMLEKYYDQISLVAVVLGVIFVTIVVLRTFVFKKKQKEPDQTSA